LAGRSRFALRLAGRSLMLTWRGEIGMLASLAVGLTHFHSYYISERSERFQFLSAKRGL